MDQKTELILAQLMQYLPVSLTSQIGAFFGKKEILKEERLKQQWIVQFNNTIEYLTGIKSHKEKRTLLMEYGKQVGRLYAETTVLQRINRKGLIKIDGLNNLQNRSIPSIFTAPHLSNWEVSLKVFTTLENPTCVLYEPRENSQRMAIVNKARLAWSNKIQLVSTDEPMVLKKLKKALENNSNIYILADEEKDGYVYAPSLGRSIPYSGNRWLVSKLASKYLLDVIPMYVERTQAVSFTIHIDKKISPQNKTDVASNAKMIADKIDTLFDLWVRKCPEHWYWMPYLDLKKPYTN